MGDNINFLLNFLLILLECLNTLWIPLVLHICTSIDSFFIKNSYLRLLTFFFFTETLIPTISKSFKKFLKAFKNESEHIYAIYFKE